MTPAPPPGRRLPSPEQLAGALSAIVILAVSLAIVRPTASPSNPASPPPASPGSPATPSPTGSVDAGAIEIARAVNRRLAEGDRALSVELEANPLDVPAVQVILRQMNPHLRLGLDIAARLQSSDRSRATGKRLARFYEELSVIIDATLKASTQNEAAYRSGALAVSTRLRDLSDLNAALAALLVATLPPSGAPSSAPTSPPSPGPRPTPSAVASAGVTPSPRLSPTPTPTTAAVDNQLTNGGFEGSIDPWQIATEPGAVAVGALDASNPAAGATSLRVTITSATSSRAGISVRQLGVNVQPGVRYRLSVRVRAETSREVRLSVGSTSQRPYASNLGVAGRTWADVQLEFLAIAGDTNAVVSIDLGRDTATTWLDEVVFAPVEP